MSTDQYAALQALSPIVLDLNGDGVHTLSASQGVNFDLSATGKADKVGWVGGGDGLLVRDVNHDGVINNGSELFGSSTVLADGQRAGDGYNALTALDSNHDHVIDAQDAQFSELKVWIDVNHDGKTDLGELHGLVDLNINRLDLNYSLTDRMDNGNAVALVGSYHTNDGQTHEMADVWFAKDAPAVAAAPKLSELLADAHTDLAAHLPAAPGNAPAASAAVPTIEPTGPAPSAHQASFDEELLRQQNSLL